LVLEEAARIDFEAWPDAKKIGNTKVNALVFALFPMVHGANVKNAAVRDLTCRGRGMERVRPMNSRYTLSGIHLFNAVGVKIERVAVRDWPADGLSVQTGERALISRCEATGCLGNGLHPGTGLKDSVIEDCLTANNGAGIYLCWHNRGHVFRRNRIVRNREGGITGLGNPGDRNNVFEENLIAENGGPGIVINGGQVSGNVIRNNTIENNSRSAPGKHPGILIHAATEDARNYTVAGNTIRDTQAMPSQHVGVEERNGVYRDKPTAADENLIEGNSYSGHVRADVIVVGPATTVTEKPEVKVVRQ
jgi:parallel beta-helix repeat protein